MQLTPTRCAFSRCARVGFSVEYSDLFGALDYFFSDMSYIVNSARDVQLRWDFR